eukprot:814995-Pelagomonas_calceolata.AAC.1
MASATANTANNWHIANTLPDFILEFSTFVFELLPARRKENPKGLALLPVSRLLALKVRNTRSAVTWLQWMLHQTLTPAWASSSVEPTTYCPDYALAAHSHLRLVGNPPVSRWF